MLLGGAVEAVVLLAFLVPLRRRLIGDPLPRVEGPFATHPVVGLLAPLADFLDRIIVVAPHADDGSRARRLAGAYAVFVAPLLALALVPLGVEYAFASRDIALVAVRADGGLVWLVVALLVGLYGATTLLPSQEARVRFGVMTISFGVAAGFAVAALAMVLGSIDPLALAIAQDRSLDIGDFFGPALPALQRLELPAWGLFLQPVSFVLFGVCGVAIPSLAISATSEGEDDERIAPRDGIEAFLVDSGRHAGALVLAAWWVVLFFGGGALPFVTGEEVAAVIAPHFGSGLATILTMVLHIGVFVAKLMLATVVLEPVRNRLESLGFERALGLCWRYAIPFALLNVFVTAQWLIGGGVV